MSRDKKDLHSELVTAYEYACEEYSKLYPSDPKPFLTQTHRSNGEQNKLYAIGRTEKGKIVTNAKGGESPHNFLPSMAFDIAFITLTKQLSWDKKYFKKFADIIKSKFPQVECGIDWRFVDPPHFELKAWKTLKK
jgi:peptidoglycan L-alanyl-D-glutamate endopeptidase CwlK